MPPLCRLYCRLFIGVAVLLMLVLLMLLFCSATRKNRAPRCAGRRVKPAPIRQRGRRKAAWVVREIIRLKALTDLSCYKLADTFNRMHATATHVTGGKTWVADTVRHHRYEIADLRKQYKRSIPPALPRNTI